jgi:hypothetical protein
MCHQAHQSIFFYFVHQYIFSFEFLRISFLVIPLITQINFSCLEKRMKKGNNNRDCLWRLQKKMNKGNNNCDWRGRVFLTWSFLVFHFLANYLWMAQLPLAQWRNNSFLNSSNHAVILSLFFFSLTSHRPHQSIFLYFVHQYPSFWVL